MGECKDTEIGSEKADCTDSGARPEVLPDDGRIDLRPCKEGEKNRPDAGQVVDPVRCKQSERIPRQCADHDLDKGHRYLDSDG
jgi:hypothetical protein